MPPKLPVRWAVSILGWTSPTERVRKGKAEARTFLALPNTEEEEVHMVEGGLPSGALYWFIAVAFVIGLLFPPRRRR